MKKLLKKAASLVLSAAMVLSMAAAPVFAANTAPSTAPSCEVTDSIFSSLVKLKFTSDDASWLDAVDTVTVNGTTYTKASYSSSLSFASDPTFFAGKDTGSATGEDRVLLLTKSFTGSPVTVLVTATGYPDVALTLTESGDGYTVSLADTSEPEPEPDPKPSETPDAGEKKAPPTGFTTASSFGYDFVLTFAGGSGDFLSSITSVTVNGTAWSKGSNSYSVWNNSQFYADPANLRLVIGEGYDVNPATCVITADGYQDLTLTLDKTTHTATVVDTTPVTYSVTVANCENGSATVSPETAEAGQTVTVTATPNESYVLSGISVSQTDSTAVDTVDTDTGCTFQMPAEDVTVTAVFELIPMKTISVEQLSLSQDTFGNDWYITIKDADGYVDAITEISVNDAVWEAKRYSPSSGGSYQKDPENSRLIFAAKNYSPSSAIDVLKSGDVISITAAGYEALRVKLLIDPDGNASLVEDDGQGDLYELHVKIVGDFEAAIVGQENYDGVSGATGSASSNKNSNVTVYGARTEKGSIPADSDWKELDASADSSSGYVTKCTVSIVPDTEQGTDENASSGMTGSFWPAISSSLTLSGTPKDAGSYLISVAVTDDQGRTAASNALPFRIYTGKEALADRISPDNLTQTQDGKYMWDIMEPWAISEFGSNVDGEEDSVRIPKDLKAWYGSHQSGTYGYLGYDLAWEEVEAGNIPQTLYIPSGCNLTMVNMEILSSVRVVVENGGKLTLRDSVVQGIIDVQSGGTFSMNYNDYGSGEFLTGSSICGQLRMADGAVLENAAIYSHANYLANGDLVDRTTAEPVVAVTGNVTVKGQVFIQGDAGGSKIGQAGLSVKNGTLTLADGAVLAVYGGEGTVVDTKGGTAIELEQGTITGSGKLIAIGGRVLWKDGGCAVSGTGTISTDDVYLQGATSSKAQNGKPGTATKGEITITSGKRHVADGTQKETTADDPLESLYWKSGIDPTPDLSQYPTAAYTPEEPSKPSETPTKPSETPAAPSEAPAKPSETPTTPSETPTKPSETPAKPSETPAAPSETPTKPSETPAKPSETPTNPSEKPTVSFTDVEMDSWYTEAIQWAVANNITTGLDSTTFGTKHLLTRGQMVTFLWRAAGSPEPAEAGHPYADVKAGSYYEKAVLWAVAQGITNGTSSTTFSPNAPCTRGQTVTFLWRAAGKPQASGSTAFADLNPKAYYYEAVQWAAEQGITNGIGGGRFDPDSACTRSQGVTFLYRASSYLK